MDAGRLGVDRRIDEHADEFFEDMERVYPHTSISIVDLKGSFHRDTHSTGKKLPKTAEVYTTDDADKLVDKIQHKFIYF